MRLLILYFSATGNTATITKALENEFNALGAEVSSVDVTPRPVREARIDLAPYEAVVFGAPIHSWRAPRVVREWMNTLDGEGKKAAMFFTYGGFQVHPTHYSTREILAARNFTVVASADFPGAHTFNIGGWRAMTGRPDETDLETAREYARATYRRFTGEDSGVLGALEKTEHAEETLDAIEVFRFKVLTELPTRRGEDCGMCLTCEEVCPTGAMAAEAGTADAERCIACLACVAHCPEDALKINDMSGSWTFKLEMEKATEDDIKGKNSRIYL